MTVSLTIKVDEGVLPALDAVASRRSVSRETILADAIGHYLAAQPGGESGTSTIQPVKETAATPPGGTDVRRKDPYLTYLDGLLDEWHSPGDAEAFDGL